MDHRKQQWGWYLEQQVQGQGGQQVLDLKVHHAPLRGLQTCLLEFCSSHQEGACELHSLVTCVGIAPLVPSIPMLTLMARFLFRSDACSKGLSDGVSALTLIESVLMFCQGFKLC